MKSAAFFSPGCWHPSGQDVTLEPTMALIQTQAGVYTTTNNLSQSVSCSHPAGTLLLLWHSEKGQQQALVEPICSCSCHAVPGPALPLFACRLMPMWGIPLSSSIFCLSFRPYFDTLVCQPCLRPCHQAE